MTVYNTIIDMYASPVIRHPLLAELYNLLANPDFSAHLSSTLSGADVRNNEHVYLRIDATVCFPNRAEADRSLSEKSLPLVRGTWWMRVL